VFKLLRVHCNAKVWFDSVNKKIICNDSRTNHGTISYITKTPDRTSAGKNIDKVIVLGASESIKGIAGSGSKTQIYRYTDCNSITEATKIAETILSEVTEESVRIEIDCPPVTTYHEGDLVTVDGTQYQVHDVNIEYEKTVLGIGSSEVSIFDQFQGAIQKVTGVVTIDDSNYAKLDQGNVFTGGTNEFNLIQAVQYGGIAGNHLVIKGPLNKDIQFKPGGQETPALKMFSEGTLAVGYEGGYGTVTLDGKRGDVSTMTISKSGPGVMKLKVPSNGLIQIQIG
jgi:hypothetical protein